MLTSSVDVFAAWLLGFLTGAGLVALMPIVRDRVKEDEASHERAEKEKGRTT